MNRRDSRLRPPPNPLPSVGSGQALNQEGGCVDQDLVADIVRCIVETAQPDKIILFGSRARGDARPNSDFDVLVIKESAEPRYRRSVPLYVALAHLPIEVEVIVYTPAEVEEWRGVPQAFVTTAVREGTTIYERPG
jgi:uncharacterized protein